MLRVCCFKASKKCLKIKVNKGILMTLFYLQEIHGLVLSLSDFFSFETAKKKTMMSWVLARTTVRPFFCNIFRCFGLRQKDLTEFTHVFAFIRKGFRSPPNNGFLLSQASKQSSNADLKSQTKEPPELIWFYQFNHGTNDNNSSTSL